MFYSLQPVDSPANTHEVVFYSLQPVDSPADTHQVAFYSLQPVNSPAGTLEVALILSIVIPADAYVVASLQLTSC